MVPWGHFTKNLVHQYLRKPRRGQPPCGSAVLLKMLLVTYPNNLSESQAELVSIDTQPIKWFLDLAVDEPAADHSMVTKFKGRLLERGKLGGGIVGADRHAVPGARHRIGVELPRIGG